HDTGSEQTADQRDERCTPDPSAEAVQAEQPGDAEHGDETEEKRGRRDSAEIETEVDGAEKAAEEVVEDQRQEEESAPEQQARSEDEIRRTHSPSTSDCILGRGALNGCRALSKSTKVCW